MKNEGEHLHRNRAPIFGIFLIFLGAVLLLQAFNVLSWDLWGTLWHFWPVIIIIIGLAILLRSYSVWIISLLTVVILGASLGFAIWQNNTGIFSGEISTVSYVQPLKNLGQADVNIDFNAGRLSANSLPSGSSSLIEAQVDTTNNVSSLRASFFSSNGSGQLSLNSANQQFWPGGGIHWDLNFTRDIPLSFNIKNAASSADYDFSKLQISQINLDLNAGSCDMTLPVPSGIMPVNITDNAASVDISIPDDAAARIHATTNVGNLNTGNRFIKQGNDYITGNYEGAANRIEFDITTNVGSVHIE